MADFTEQYLRVASNHVRVGRLARSPTTDEIKAVGLALLTGESESISGHIEVAKELRALAREFEGDFAEILKRSPAEAAQNLWKSQNLPIPGFGSWLKEWPKEEATALHNAAMKIGLVLLNLDDQGKLKITPRRHRK